MAEQTRARLFWQQDLRFVARSDSGHGVVVDSPKSETAAGASPMELFLIGVGGCTAIDVVSILKKMREHVTGLEVELAAERAPSHPKYFTTVEILYRVRGRGLDRSKVERAVELSHSTYCSASASLRADCPIRSRIEMVEDDH
jgi:putative redox protein